MWTGWPCWPMRSSSTGPVVKAILSWKYFLAFAALGILSLVAMTPLLILKILLRLCGRFEPHANLIEMPQQIGRIVVHPVGTRPFELVLPVPARKQADSQRQGPSRGEHVPDAVADDDAAGDWDVELLGGS